jgi:hypothetical protein
VSVVVDALGWDHASFMMSVYCVPLPRGMSDPDFDVPPTPPTSVKRYELIDDEPGASIPLVVEYDLVFAVLPDPLAPYLQECLRRVRDAGAQVAWLAFEGAFHFEHLLTRDIAHQVYGVCVTGTSRQSPSTMRY